MLIQIFPTFFFYLINCILISVPIPLYPVMKILECGKHKKNEVNRRKREKQSFDNPSIDNLSPYIK